MNTIEVVVDGLVFDVWVEWEDADYSAGIHAGWDIAVDECWVTVKDPDEAIGMGVLWGDGVWREGDVIHCSPLLTSVFDKLRERVEESAAMRMQGVGPEDMDYGG